MNYSRIVCFLICLSCLCSHAAEPLRVFIRGGAKSHGPGAHEHEKFLADWTKLLGERGLKAAGARNFPTAEQLRDTDVLLLYAQNGGTVPPEDRPALDDFLKRGGGLVVIHTASVSADTAHWKSIVGGAWVNGSTKWLEGPMSLYYVDSEHPITKGASNFDLDDEIYYDMDLSPDIRVLAAAYTPKITTSSNSRKAEESSAGGKRASVYDIQPQMWTYERTLPEGKPYRAFVSIPGHLYVNFARPNYRAILLRGIAWAGKRENLDEFCNKEELAALRYCEGGPTAPEQAASKVEIHPDFNMELVAAEPLIAKPINIDWDARGRLWVAETPEYPNGRRAPNVERWKDSGSLIKSGEIAQRPARDRISILIDENRDGRPDRKEVFYEGLELVTGFVLHRDGVIAAAAPDIWLIRDTDKDGKADKVEKLYTGLGIYDTHAVINNLRWGFDGWIYATHGYSGSDAVYNGGRSKNFGRIGSGVVRFKPDGSAFEQYSSKGGNTWGLDIAWDNEVFYTQPTSGELLMHIVLPEHILARGQAQGTRSYQPLIVRRKSFPVMTSEMQAYVQIDLVGSFTASAGCAIYDGGAWPREWNYSYFTTEPTINLVHHEVVKKDGVTFSAAKNREPEFMAAHDLWFRPIETRVGPDGHLYLCDFYNQAVIHNDTRGPRHGPANAAVRPDRDHYFGRIWRVSHKQSQKLRVPDQPKYSEDQLVQLLEHPNRHVRMNAFRLLTENGPQTTLSKELAAVVQSEKSPEARVAALWAMHHRGQLTPALLTATLADAQSALRKNAAQIAGLRQDSSVEQALIERLSDEDPAARLQAIVALGNLQISPAAAKALVKVFPNLNDTWSQSAAVGVGAKNSPAILAAALEAGHPALARLIGPVIDKVSASPNSAAAAQIAQLAAGHPSSPEADVLKQAALEGLARASSAAPAPAWNGQLRQALEKLLNSANPALAASALPLVAQWDKEKSLAPAVKRISSELMARLNDTSLPDEQRGQTAGVLLGARALNPEILPAMGAILKQPGSPVLQRRIIEGLGSASELPAGKALAEAYPLLSQQLRAIVFGQLLKREDWAGALLDEIEAGRVKPTEINLGDFYLLRTHRDTKVASRATEIWNKTRGAEGVEKNALIAKLRPAVEKRGDPARGKELFVANCATCHQFNDIGVNVGPVLTGMGAHGPAELLTAIIDPNREADPSFHAWDLETKDEESFNGIIVRENNAAVVLRNALGEKEVPVAQIKSRKNSGRSLMPEGFEALGDDGLRDLLSFITAGESRFRFVDLAPAFTADSRRGIYISEANTTDTLKFKKFGIVQVEGVPFNIVDPARHPNGKNLIVLKGGPGNVFSKSFAQKVEAPLGFAARKLHFLGGVAGWGHPGGGPGAPVMKATAHFSDGKTEEIVMRNGEEFADYIAVIDVPGSKLVRDVVTANQLRVYTKTLRHGGTIDKITLESYDNTVAPTTVAITAETAEVASAPEPAASPTSPLPRAASIPSPLPRGQGQGASNGGNQNGLSWAPGTRALLIGGGSAHDYQRWFNTADTAILKEAGYSVQYTEDAAVAARELPGVQVVVLSINHRDFPRDAVKKALNDHLNAGKALVLLHPGVWYNWPNWPEFNQTIAGGGSRGHDRLGEFEVKITNAGHPLTKGLPPSFKIIDELYWFETAPQATPIDVLATAHSPQKDKTYPMLWIVKHPKARIAALTLGHDGRAHDLPEFKQLLRNAVAWTLGKE